MPLFGTLARRDIRCTGYSPPLSPAGAFPAGSSLCRFLGPLHGVTMDMSLPKLFLVQLSNALRTALIFRSSRLLLYTRTRRSW